MKIAEIKVKYTPAAASEVEITNSKNAYQILKGLISPDTISLKEEVICIYLNQSNRVLGWYKVSSGGISGTVVDIRIILGIALKTAASGIILCHNHPSGSLRASQADIDVTQKLKKASELMDIRLIDHLIITAHQYLSFGDEGML